MNNEQYIAKTIAEQSQLTPNQVVDSFAPGVVEKFETDEDVARPVIAAYEQGQRAIVEKVETEDRARREDIQNSRIAMAVAEAMRPETVVGKIKKEEIVRGTPMDTAPEGKLTRQAGVEAVGKAGRKAVFSELPFEPDDLPDGYSTYESPRGGYFAAPSETMEEVIYHDSLDERHVALGYPLPKPDQSDGTTVTVKDSQGRTVQDVLVDEYGSDAYDMTIKQAEELSKELKGEVEVRTAEDSLKEREEELVSEDLFRAFSTVEGYESKVYTDTVGKKTVGVGFNMDQKGARKMWSQAGVNQSFDKIHSGKEELSDTNIRKLLKLTLADSEKKAFDRAEQLGLDWDSMPEWHKAIVTDIAFNTGDVSKWTKVFTNKQPLAVLMEARRKAGGKHTRGMDNRVARIGFQLGILKDLKQAHAIGLKLADLSQYDIAKLKREGSHA